MLYYLSDNPAAGIILIILLVFSIMLHELAHGFVALKCGDPTAKYSGRLSLNPIAHFDLIGFIMLFTVGFGYAKPVPINPDNFKNYKKGCFLVSIAGVTVNILFSFIFLGLSFAFLIIATKLGEGFPYFIFVALYGAFYYASFCNLTLCFFNLLPLFPLDGFNALQTIVGYSNSVVRFLRKYGNMILLTLFVLDFIVRMFGFPSYFSPFNLYFEYTAGYVFDGFSWIWIKLLGLMGL